MSAHTAQIATIMTVVMIEPTRRVVCLPFLFLLLFAILTSLSVNLGVCCSVWHFPLWMKRGMSQTAFSDWHNIGTIPIYKTRPARQSDDALRGEQVAVISFLR
jgi:hypothetical protein